MSVPINKHGAKIRKFSEPPTKRNKIFAKTLTYSLDKLGIRGYRLAEDDKLKELILPNLHPRYWRRYGLPLHRRTVGAGSSCDG